MREIKFPTYLNTVPELSHLLINVVVENKVDFDGIVNAEIQEVGKLFPECTFSELDLTNMCLSKVWKFVEAFSEITADKLVLPFSIGSEFDEVNMSSMFRNSSIKEIVNLDALPFDKAHNTILMFAGFTGTNLIINSSLEKVFKCSLMFFEAHNIEIHLPKLERPLDSNIFNDIKNCKIYLPKLKKLPSKMYASEFTGKINDTNELFVSEIVAEQIVK